MKFLCKFLPLATSNIQREQVGVLYFITNIIICNLGASKFSKAIYNTKITWLLIYKGEKLESSLSNISN